MKREVVAILVLAIFPAQVLADGEPNPCDRPSSRVVSAICQLVGSKRDGTEKAGRDERRVAEARAAVTAATNEQTRLRSEFDQKRTRANELAATIDRYDARFGAVLDRVLDAEPGQMNSILNAELRTDQDRQDFAAYREAYKQIGTTYIEGPLITELKTLRDQVRGQVTAVENARREAELVEQAQSRRVSQRAAETGLEDPAKALAYAHDIAAARQLITEQKNLAWNGELLLMDVQDLYERAGNDAQLIEALQMEMDGALGDTLLGKHMDGQIQKVFGKYCDLEKACLKDSPEDKNKAIDDLLKVKAQTSSGEPPSDTPGGTGPMGPGEIPSAGSKT